MVEQADLEALVREIRPGAQPDETRLGKLLTARDVSQRQRANLLFSSAYAAIGESKTALDYLRRAYDVGAWNIEVFQSLFDALMAAGRVRDAIDCAREAIVLTADRGDVRHVYAIFGMLSNAAAYPQRAEMGIADPRADRLVAWALEKVFSGTAAGPKSDVFSGRKIKVGLMLAGDNFENSALTRTALSFARHHDPEKFDVHVYSLLTLAENRKSNPQYDAWLNEISQWGCAYHEGLPAQGLARVLATAKAIAIDDLDVLFFNMLIGDYYILSLLRPAPILIGNIHGDPVGYATRSIDATIAGDPHAQMESVAYSYHLRPFLDFEIIKPDAQVTPPTRPKFGVSDTSVLIVSGGQGYKLDSTEFWSVVGAVLSQRQNAEWLIVTSELEIARKHIAHLAPDVQVRLKLVSWRRDYVENILPMADIVVDTFPAGGSLALFWAMLLGKPCVAFRSNIAGTFSTRAWTGAFALLRRSDLAVPHGDLDSFIQRIISFVDLPERRLAFGQECKEAAAKLSDSRQYIAEMEAAIIDTIARKLRTG